MVPPKTGDGSCQAAADAEFSGVLPRLPRHLSPQAHVQTNHPPAPRGVQSWLESVRFLPADHSYGCYGGKIVFATAIAGRWRDCVWDPANLTLPASMRMARLALAAGVVTPGTRASALFPPALWATVWQCGFDLGGLFLGGLLECAGV
jgi:hypothetical protein